MRVCQKQINFLLLLSLSMLFFLPVQALAEEDGAGKGRMEIKTDRIQQGDEEDTDLKETELDKTFPNLFHEETEEKITTEQSNRESEIEGIKDYIFHEELPQISLYDIKKDLFTEEYESPGAIAIAEEAPESDSLSSFVFYGSITGIIGVVGCGITMILKRWE